MVFSSILFLLFFLPALFLCYFCLPARFRAVRNVVLLAFSLFFYACGGTDYLPVLLSSIAVNYLCGCWPRQNTPRRFAVWGCGVQWLSGSGCWVGSSMPDSLFET